MRFCQLAADRDGGRRLRNGRRCLSGSTGSARRDQSAEDHSDRDGGRCYRDGKRRLSGSTGSAWRDQSAEDHSDRDGGRRYRDGKRCQSGSAGSARRDQSAEDHSDRNGGRRIGMESVVRVVRLVQPGGTSQPRTTLIVTEAGKSSRAACPVQQFSGRGSQLRGEGVAPPMTASPSATWRPWWSLSSLLTTAGPLSSR